MRIPVSSIGSSPKRLDNRKLLCQNNVGLEEEPVTARESKMAPKRHQSPKMATLRALKLGMLRAMAAECKGGGGRTSGDPAEGY